MSNLLQFISFL